MIYEYGRLAGKVRHIAVLVVGFSIRHGHSFSLSEEGSTLLVRINCYIRILGF